MSGAREKAVQWALSQLGAPVMMGYRGDLRFDREHRTLMPHGLGCLCWDCSGLMAGAVHFGAGGPDLRGTHNAQLFHDGMRELGTAEVALPGDGVFYGHDAQHIIHIGIWCAGGKVISADGATWGITSFEQAKAGKCRVRLHETMFFRPDQAFSEVRRNVYLDAIDGVAR